MGTYQFWLVFQIVIALAITLSNSTNIPQYKNDDILNTNQIHSDTPMALNPNLNKMLPTFNITKILEQKKRMEQEKNMDETTSLPVKTTAEVNKGSSAEKKNKSGKIPLAEDPRFNKMLPVKNILKNDNKDSSLGDDDYDNYVDDYNYDDYNYDESNENKTSTNQSVTDKSISTDKKLKPIKGSDKVSPKSAKISNEETEDEEDDDDDYDDDDDDDIPDEGEIVYNQNVPCPRDCICARNLNSYLVATCSRLDADVQKFGSDISDLVVVDIEPKYPIILGPEFFVKIGLKHVTSIKISNCTIEMIHPTAFHGLKELYAVNLTNVGLSMIYPDTFDQNNRLRLLTISGNDLTVLTHRGAAGSNYLLKSSTVEELDLSNNNLNELQSSAFSKLTNIVYINLSQNNIKTLPENIFDSVETIEELDLSSNAIQTLPRNIFNRTALAILHLKYNDITGDLGFITSDLQQLDLSYNTIKQINNHMFAKMEGLTSLYLKGNGLIKVQPDSFASLKNLRHIDLSFNDLDQVSSLLFYKNNDLDVIRLNDNPRLSELPTDGFQSYTGEFSVYLLDISNCAVGALGQKTFITMPHLTTLKLSWNNINNLHKGIFNSLDRLTELDLSNNLIVKLDQSMFYHNTELSKLNLAGNPLKELSSKLFTSMTNLKELDVSDCELHSLLLDSYLGSENKYRFYDTLRSFNASYNKINKINKNEIQYFRNLKTFDIKKNPLKCNDDFKGLVKYLTKKNIVSGKVNTLANLDDSFALPAQSLQGWDELAKTVCKRFAKVKLTEIKKPTTFKTIDTSPENPKTDIKLLDGNENKISENDEDNDEYDDEDGDDVEYDDDLEEEKAMSTSTKNPIKGGRIEVEEIDVIKETDDKFLRDKLLDDDDLEDGEEIIIERGKIYYGNYRYIVPMLIVILSVIVFLLLIGKIVSIIMRKRGERYRMAILASKNSIVYQKLSEDIAAQQYKTHKNPKVHRYARINEV